MVKFVFRCLFVAVLSIVSVVSSVAKETVDYTYRALAAEGCNVEYSISKQDTSYYIIVTVTSDRMFFLDEPTMKVRTFNDEVITLSGTVIGNNSSSNAYLIGSVMLSEPEIKTTAQFAVTPIQLKAMKVGVSKVRLSLRPMNHERTFNRDKIGEALYELYLKAKAQEDDF